MQEHTAAILVIGDELVSGQSLDTNSQWLADQLAQRGIGVHEIRTVDDDRRRIATALRELIKNVPLVLTCGGLGPTDDDLTREALGDVVAPGEPLVVDERARRGLEARRRTHARRSGRDVLPSNNDKQALRPQTAQCLANPHGTAPGLSVSHNGCRIFVLPGPPGELMPMFIDHVAAALGAPADRTIAMRQIHCCGLGESQAASLLGSLTERHSEHDRPIVGTTASGSIVTARLMLRGAPQDTAPALDACAAAIRSAWGAYVFSEGDDTLSASLGAVLKQRGLMLATAESCTGGLVGDMLVSVPGSSTYYTGGVVSYSNALKTDVLSVPREMLDAYGAVSAEVAVAMVRGVMRLTHGDCGLSITGIAGPEGATADKPVGTVYIAAAIGSDDIDVRRFQFPGDRTAVRDRAAKMALQMMRLALLDDDGGARTLPLLWQVTKTGPVRAAIALGSNMGDRHAQITAAVDALGRAPGVKVIAVSTLHETVPEGSFAGVEPAMFINAAALLETTLPARRLLEVLLDIERAAGRPPRDSAAPARSRIIDLDLLLYGEEIIEEPGLSVPHPRMHERLFVLGPLAEIAGSMVHPARHRRIADLLVEFTGCASTARLQ